MYASICVWCLQKQMKKIISRFYCLSRKTQLSIVQLSGQYNVIKEDNRGLNSFKIKQLRNSHRDMLKSMHNTRKANPIPQHIIYQWKKTQTIDLTAKEVDLIFQKNLNIDLHSKFKAKVISNIHEVKMIAKRTYWQHLQKPLPNHPYCLD